jgi:ribosome-binding factor A
MRSLEECKVAFKTMTINNLKMRVDPELSFQRLRQYTQHNKILNFFIEYILCNIVFLFLN